MHESEIKKLINSLNKGYYNLIYMKPLSINVYFSEVWDPVKYGNRINVMDAPLLMYFVKDQDGVYASAVLDMGKDLHAFTLNKYRKKGILKNALINVILPHLFQSRSSQRITINRASIGLKKFNSSFGLAKSIGFQEVSKINEEGLIELKLVKSKVQKLEFPILNDHPISKVKFDEIKNAINFHVLKLKHLESEVRLGLGRQESLSRYTKHIKELEKYSYRVEDVWCNLNK